MRASLSKRVTFGKGKLFFAKNKQMKGKIVRF